MWRARNPPQRLHLAVGRSQCAAICGHTHTDGIQLRMWLVGSCDLAIPTYHMIFWAPLKYTDCVTNEGPRVPHVKKKHLQVLTRRVIGATRSVLVRCDPTQPCHWITKQVAQTRTAQNAKLHTCACDVKRTSALPRPFSIPLPGREACELARNTKGTWLTPTHTLTGHTTANTSKHVANGSCRVRFGMLWLSYATKTPNDLNCPIWSTQTVWEHGVGNVGLFGKMWRGKKNTATPSNQVAPCQNTQSAQPHRCYRPVSPITQRSP